MLSNKQPPEIFYFIVWELIPANHKTIKCPFNLPYIISKSNRMFMASHDKLKYHLRFTIHLAMHAKSKLFIFRCFHRYVNCSYYISRMFWIGITFNKNVQLKHLFTQEVPPFAFKPNKKPTNWMLLLWLQNIHWNLDHGEQNLFAFYNNFDLPLYFTIKWEV